MGARPKRERGRKMRRHEGSAKSRSNASVTRIQGDVCHPVQNGYIVSLKVLVSVRQNSEDERTAKVQALSAICRLLREVPDLHVEVLHCRRDDNAVPKIPLDVFQR